MGIASVCCQAQTRASAAAGNPLLALAQGCGDHSNNAHYVSKQLDPDDVVSDCSLNHHAFFLLLVEPGVFLGANGWHEDYDKP